MKIMNDENLEKRLRISVTDFHLTLLLNDVNLSPARVFIWPIIRPCD